MLPPLLLLLLQLLGGSEDDDRAIVFDEGSDVGVLKWCRLDGDMLLSREVGTALYLKENETGRPTVQCWGMELREEKA